MPHWVKETDELDWTEYTMLFSLEKVVDIHVQKLKRGPLFQVVVYEVGEYSMEDFGFVKI